MVCLITLAEVPVFPVVAAFAVSLICVPRFFAAGVVKKLPYPEDTSFLTDVPSVAAAVTISRASRAVTR